jgi:hypothetical protein
MLKGECGPAIRRAMEILVTLGDIYDAARMVDIVSAHLSSVAYTSSGDVGRRFLEKLIEESASFEVMTTLNPHSIEHDRWRELGFPEDFAEKQLLTTKAYDALGALPTYTCTPYLVGNLPRFGEHIAWSESSALSFANSVLGARSNREGAIGALAAALVGKTPLNGYHLNENRYGKVLVRTETDLRGVSDYSALGYRVGEKTEEKVPVFENLPHNLKTSELKALCAGLAVSGAVAMCHVVGVTPEALTLEKAFEGRNIEESITIDENELRHTYERRCNAAVTDVDWVVIGCPHCAYDELKEVASLLRGKKVRETVRLWVCTSTPIESVARRAGYVREIETAGGTVVCSCCPFVTKSLGFKTMATNSTKAAFYGSGVLGIGAWFGTMNDCVDAALTGRWGEKP